MGSNREQEEATVTVNMILFVLLIYIYWSPGVLFVILALAYSHELAWEMGISFMNKINV